MLALTFAPCVLIFALCILTFAPCACGISLRSTGATIPTCTGGGCHQLQLALVVLFYPPNGTITGFALGHLALCSSGLCWW